MFSTLQILQFNFCSKQGLRDTEIEGKWERNTEQQINYVRYLFDYTRAFLLNVTFGQLEANVQMGLTGQMYNLCQMDGQHGGLIQIVLGQDTQLGLLDKLLGLVYVRSLRIG